jgi:DNA repair protein RecN (Recombination protein N)
MLEFLHIENVAVVKSLDIEFKSGMTALTGETGAGKSIIIDSLNLLSGARADKELLRTGESRAEVTALF